MTINLNMFDLFMKDGIVDDLKSTSVVTIKRCRSRGMDLKILKKTTELNDLNRDVRHGTVFSLRTRVRQ